MPFTTGTVPAGNAFEESYKLLFRAFRRYITGAPTPGAATDPGTANTGNGSVLMFDTKVGGVAETWTFTCTAAGSPATFSVTGSVSGAQAALTTGTFYENSQIAAYIVQGGVAFVAGGTPDDFQVITTTNPVAGTNDEWVIDEYDYDGVTAIGGGAGVHEIVMHGLGLAGTDAIYLGLRLVQNAGADQYNWRLRLFTGYQAGQTFVNQPGINGADSFTAFSNTSMEYWVVVNGRRWIVVADTGTYHAMYGGFFLPYYTPLEYPYPIFAGADSPSQVAHNNGSATDFRGFWDASEGSVLRNVSGVYERVNNSTPTTDISTWPYDQVSDGWLDTMQRLSGGLEYPLFPVTLMRRSTSDVKSGDVLGELDGVFCVPGHLLGSEDLIDVGGTDYLAVQNIFRTARADFAAIRLD